MIEKTFDLSTLNLSAGVHEITVKARAIGYGDSWPSNEVSYEVATGETYTVSGTWLFNEDLGALKEDCHFKDQTINFISNGTAYMSITEEAHSLFFGGTEVYRLGTWTNEAYRTITFDGVQTVSKEFYDWFTKNAVRQTITLNIDFYSSKGDDYDYTKTVTAYSGMTWAEWVNSDYNIIGAHVDSDNVVWCGDHKLKYGSSYREPDVNPSDIIDENTYYAFVTHSK